MSGSGIVGAIAMNRSRKHVHHGLSSKEFLDAVAIFDTVEIRAGQTILDVGCGEGHFSLSAAAIVGETGLVVAVDRHESSINILRKTIALENISNVLAFTADVTKRIPVSNGVVDVGLMVNVLHGFVLNGEIPDLMQEILRVTKRHSSLMVIDFKKIETAAGPPVSERLSPAEVEELLGTYGFVADKFDDVGPYSYLITFIRR